MPQNHQDTKEHKYLERRFSQISRINKEFLIKSCQSTFTLLDVHYLTGFICVQKMSYLLLLSCLLIGTRSSADVGDIFKTELKKVHVQSFASTGNIIKFTVSGNKLYAHSSDGASGAIIWNEIGSGVVLKEFIPTGVGNEIEIVKFTSASGADGMVYLKAWSYNGESGNIVETKWRGTWVDAYYAGDGNAIHGFEAYYSTGDSAILKVESEPLAVELVSFDATGQDGYVLIEWETASEIDLLGYNLKRSTHKDSAYAQINPEFIYGRGSAVDGSSYSYQDTTVEPIHCYWYKLGEVDKSGYATWYGPVKVEYMGKGMPESIYLDVEPSMGKNSFYIKYGIPGVRHKTEDLRHKTKDQKESVVCGLQSVVSLKLYDVAGRVEKVLFEGNLHCGSYGKDLDLSDFSSGIYFLRLGVGNRYAVRKLEVF